MALLEMDVFNTHVVIRPLNPIINASMEQIANNLVTYSYTFDRKIKRLVRKKDKGYYSYNPNINEWRFSIGVLRDIMLVLGSNNIRKDDIILRKIPMHSVAEISFGWNDKYKPRDYQEKCVDIIINGDNGNAMKVALVDLFTGAGKSLVFARFAYLFKQRVLMFLLPKFIDKWCEDILSYTDCTDEDFLVVQGVEGLRTICETDPKDMKWKFIILSITTFTVYLNKYESGIIEPGLLPPDKLMEHMQAGVLFNDESHMNFAAIFKATLYMNANVFLGMTATLKSNQKDITKMHNILFPSKSRISNLAQLENYVNVEQVTYSLNNAKHIQYKTPQGYNHVIYEQFIMRHSLFLRNYMDMIVHYFKKRYLDTKQPGERCLIYCATIKMCQVVAGMLQDLYPDLSIGTYVEDDAYDDIISNDVSISTLGSASTGLNIPKLVTVISTVSVSSQVSNLQSLGRLRKIEGKELWYVYLVCRDIPPHRKHAQDRKQAIEHTVKNYTYDYYSIPVSVR